MLQQVTRRTFLASLAPAKQPNVLFISVDDLNDWVGCLGGYPGVKTPNIDALARRGALFADTHCAAPLCNPSRTALLSGKRPSTTGIYGNEQWWRPVHPELVTLPMFFRQNGYLAAGAGKVFHHTAGFNPPDQWDEFQLQVFDDPWYRRPEWYPWTKKEPAPKGHPFNGLDNFQGEFDWGVIPDKVLVSSNGTSAARFNEAVGFGLDFMVVNDPRKAGSLGGKGEMSWGGAAGTWFWVDPTNDLYFVGMVQRLGGTGGEDLQIMSRLLTYQALVKPEN